MNNIVKKKICLVKRPKKIFFTLENSHLEVKSSHGSTLRSLYLFLDTHPKSTLAIRFSSLNYCVINKLDSRPLYAAASLAHDSQKEALAYLVSTDKK